MRNQLVYFCILFCVLLSGPSRADTSELSAAEIMKAVDDRYTGDTQISTSTLILIDSKNRERIRDLKLIGMEDKSVDKSIIYFLSPADVKGTAYMSFDWVDETKEDDAWLYLPALQKIKRVAASDESGSFMGSDFSYADINGVDYVDFNYTMLKTSEKVDGVDCWVIKSIPKNDQVIDKTGYTESTNWVRKDIFMVIQSKIEVKKAKKTKYFSASDIEKIGDVWTAKKLQMITTRNNKKQHASVIQFIDVRYNQNVDASIFDTQALQRGI